MNDGGIREIRAIKMLAKNPAWTSTLDEGDRNKLIEKLVRAADGANARMLTNIMQTLAIFDSNDIQRIKTMLAAEKLEAELSEGVEDEIDFTQGADG